MTRARELARLANENVFTAEDYNSPVQVGINSTDPTSTLDVRGELKVGTAIQAGTAGVVTATEFSGSIGTFSGAGSFGGNLDVTGNVTIGGTLTYEDVTNIDVIGIVTAQNGVKISAEPAETSMHPFLSILLSWFPMLLLIGVWIFFMRQMQSGGGKEMGFGNSKAC